MKKGSSSGSKENLRIRRLFERQISDELRLIPARQSHDRLRESTKILSTDYEPWGNTVRTDIADCSCGCAHYHELAGRAGADWGVCTNPASPRVGLLTFEHQGCPQFVSDPRWDYLSTANGRTARQRLDEHR